MSGKDTLNQWLFGYYTQQPTSAGVDHSVILSEELRCEELNKQEFGLSNMLSDLFTRPCKRQYILRKVRLAYLRCNICNKLNW